MEKHFHDVFVKETPLKVIEILCSQGFVAKLHPTSENSDETNGYIKDLGAISSCVYWKKLKDDRHERVIREFIRKIPPKAMTCIQTISSAKRFNDLRKAIAEKLTIVKDCDCSKSHVI